MRVGVSMASLRGVEASDVFFGWIALSAMPAIPIGRPVHNGQQQDIQNQHSELTNIIVETSLLIIQI